MKTTTTAFLMALGLGLSALNTTAAEEVDTPKRREGERPHMEREGRAERDRPALEDGGVRARRDEAPARPLARERAEERERAELREHPAQREPIEQRDRMHREDARPEGRRRRNAPQAHGPLPKQGPDVCSECGRPMPPWMAQRGLGAGRGPARGGSGREPAFGPQGGRGGRQMAPMQRGDRGPAFGPPARRDEREPVRPPRGGLRDQRRDDFGPGEDPRPQRQEGRPPWD